MNRFTLAGICLLLMASCAKDDCTCPDNEPNDGDPMTDPREQYVGDYLVSDSLYAFGEFAGLTQYVMSVDYGMTLEDTLFFYNYGNSGDDLFALELNGFVSIPNQIGSGMGVIGSGSIDSLGFFINYSEDIFEHRAYGVKED